MKSKGYRINRKAPLSEYPAFLSAEPQELRLLSALLYAGEAKDTQELAALSGLNEAEAAAAIAYWRGAGLLLTETEPKQAVPPVSAVKTPAADPYRSSEYLAGRIEDGNLRDLLNECARIYGQMPDKTETETVLYLLDACGLEADFLLMLFSYCSSLGKKSYRYAEKVAKSLTEQGISTVASLDAYLQRQALLHSAEGKIRRLFGIGERALTKKEAEQITAWLADFKYGEDIIGLAFDKTVNSTSRVTVGYTHKILAAWYEAGVRTLKDAEAKLEAEKVANSQKYQKPAQKKQPEKPRLGNFDTDEFFNRAVQRSYENYKKKEEEKKKNELQQ